ncbi:Uncharacterised protein [Mycobacteroides abscessus subsp. abscessus]|nr:Uncharacterised protein [Mycobacteroides abscessus subsp. abscessus]
MSQVLGREGEVFVLADREIGGGAFGVLGRGGRQLGGGGFDGPKQNVEPR